MGRLEGKVALITGTGGGQGRAAALLFAAEGATVVGCDLKTDGASETVDAVRAAGGRMDSSAHTATKGGVIALARQLAAEGAWHGIRVNCISPGMIMTPATQDDIFGDPTHPMYRIRDHIPLGRIGTPDDIAPAALFLASDESAYMTGANLVIDGGWSIVLPGAPPRPRT